ncbi:MAG TPA: S8 family peptidase [Rubricoccaceae bacterium]|nr:S8 family peptidase [Rubricoccaceae bacterium]
MPRFAAFPKGTLRFFALFAALLVQTAAAQPEDWYHLDARTDGIPGVSTARAYALLDSLGRTPAREVVVAVLDGGVDLAHEDLQGRLWTNADEAPGNRRDDDRNGYVDDVHGWSFLGGADGRNVQYDTYELTREVAALRARFGDRSAADIAAADRADFARYEQLRAELAQKRSEKEQEVAQLTEVQQVVHEAREVLRRALGRAEFTMDDVMAFEPTKPEEEQAKGIYMYLSMMGATVQDLDDAVTSARAALDYGYNLDFDPRSIIGDNYADLSERHYGNPDVAGPDPGHGTAVSGVIAAARGNGLGIEGIAPATVRIMPVRVVPDGDERDKDVANAIRYAVDNGAHIINMSFGKGYSPQKGAVDEAVRYAAERGVLLVHAAGNSGEDIDVAANFPTRRFTGGGEASNWIEVGASTSTADALAASFSNYGATSVDVFAPGERVYSLNPGNGYGAHDGTSLAAPVVSGVAALLLAYYPELTPLQVRQILLDSATRYPTDMPVPGGDGTTTGPFGRLSITGGVVNAEAAVRRAEALARRGD